MIPVVKRWARVAVAVVGALVGVDAGTDVVADTRADFARAEGGAQSDRLEKAASRDSGLATAAKSLICAILITVAGIGGTIPQSFHEPGHRYPAVVHVSLPPQPASSNPASPSYVTQGEANRGLDPKRLAQAFNARSGDMRDLVARSVPASALENLEIEAVRTEAVDRSLSITIETRAKPGREDPNALHLILRAAQALFLEKCQSIGEEGVGKDEPTEVIVNRVIERQLKSAGRLANTRDQPRMEHRG